ncbi:MAG TPA: hypothetical protein VGO40_04935 [Longimicrobium sp.]|jgi:hypothetical protein|nr:hypothetical protein [Longimicrobium sp.]
MPVMIDRRLATLAVAAAVAAAGCGRKPSTGSPPAVHAVAAADSVPVPRKPGDRCRWEGAPQRMSARQQGGRPDYDSATIAKGVAVRCALREAGPEVRVVVRGEYSIPKQVDVYSPPGARAPAQTLALENEQPASRGGDLLVGEDLNDDGWTDLRVQTWSGSAGVSHDVFMWNPQRSRFEQDSVLPRGVGLAAIDGRPCVSELGWAGIGLVGGGEDCWSAGGWHEVRTWRMDLKENGPGARTSFYVRTTDWKDGERVIRTQVDTLPESVRDHLELLTSPPDPRTRSARKRGR